jgi:beta-glucosidase
MKSGYEAQLKSVVMLKNTKHQMPVQKEAVVYVPKQYVAERKDFFGNTIPEKWENAVNPEIVKKYFKVTENPSDADLALVFVRSPDSGPGYNKEDLAQKGNGYVPISLQYGPYTAKMRGAQSMAAGDPLNRELITVLIKTKLYKAANQSDRRLFWIRKKP